MKALKPFSLAVGAPPHHRTNHGTGFVDLKELFMYKVQEKIGYGPKTDFVPDRHLPETGVEEGIMIVTQDSGYTKSPGEKEKSFKTFSQIKDQFDLVPVAEVGESTKKDLIIIDMLSRIFCLGDVMVNAGNFGVVEVSQRDSDEVKSKWKVVDFLPPRSENDESDRYTCVNACSHQASVLGMYPLAPSPHMTI